MKYLLLLALFLGGCGESKVDTYNLPFIDMPQSTIYLVNQKIMCDAIPDSMFCSNSPTVGDIKPTIAYASNIVKNLNTKYKLSDDWHYTETIYEFQVRDCEDEAMTMIHHMVDEGIDKKYLYMVYQKTSETTAHIFIGIDTDEGLMHMDVNTGLAPIEAQINFYMAMNNVGIYKWIKGNIR